MRARPTRRVVVTGTGTVTPAGVGDDALWEGLLASRPVQERVRPAPRDAADPWLTTVEQRHLDPFARLAVAAAGHALTAAGLDGLARRDTTTDSATGSAAPPDPTRIAVVVGTGMGGAWAHETAVERRLERGADRVSPYTAPMAMPNAPAAAVALRFGLQGPCEGVVTACASGTSAVILAARLVASGTVDIALAGGAESCSTPSYVAALARMGALSPTGRSTPFGAERDGFCLGEGAGMLVLEPLTADYESRGVAPLAEVLGGGSSCDAHHVTAPRPDGSGALRCMRAALDDAELDAVDVAHVNAHGTGTRLNDAAEARATAALLGSRVPITSVKGVTGHLFGAAGAVEAVVAVRSLTEAVIPPTTVGARIDPAIELDVVTEARGWQPGPVLSNSFGFGGHNASLVLAPVGWRP
ncbi:MAG: beta-ketoacyl-[acyl-carrier-protein] synthase family protein [Actinomycetes bacterium]